MLAAMVPPSYAREDALIDNSDTPEVATFAGDYGVPDLRLRLTPQDGQLILYSMPVGACDRVQLEIEAPTNARVLVTRGSLLFVAPDTAVVVDAATGVPTTFFFVRTSDGRVGWLDVGGVVRLPHLDAPPPSEPTDRLRTRQRLPDSDPHAAPDGRE